jgi:glutathione S-transferase
VIQLYDFELSSSCYKIRLFLNVLQKEFEILPIGFYPAEEHKKPEFLSINPLGQLPVLRDGENLIRDSQAILVYLAAKYDQDNSWYPRDPDIMAKVSTWLSFAGGEIMNASMARLHDVLRYPYDIEQLRSAAHQAFVVLDDHLAEQELLGVDWLAAAHPTIADIACFPCVALSNDGGISRDEYPAIERWLKRVMTLPGFVDMPGILRPFDAGGQDDSK